MAPKDKAASPSAAALPKLQEVYGFMTAHDLDTLEIEEPGLKLRMVRRSAAAPAQVPVPVFAAGMGLPPPEGGRSPLPQGVGAESAMPQGVTPIKSSMMGIFYRAPSPSAPPFVKEGDAVKAGQVLCVIEAMKVFNELKAEFSGTVVKVLPENGKPVKAGQDIFWVQRA